jgi:glycosyltransferase involved in cell wall biosynthesis
VNIAILVSGLPPERIGGAEMQAMHVSRLLSADHHVRVYTRTGRVPAELSQLSGCAVIRRCAVTAPGLRFPADILLTLAALWRDRSRIDVIVAYQTLIDGLIGVLAGTLLRIPVVVSVRSPIEYRLDESRRHRLFTPFVLARATRIGVQTMAMRDDLLRVFAARHAKGALSQAALTRRLFVWPNGIEASEARATPEYVLFIGRLVPVKGAEFFIAAAGRCPDQSFVIVGDGPERARLEHAASGMRNVRFAGMVSYNEVSGYLARAKVLVIPSLQEGQSNAAMEAMVRGIPVIASRVGGLPALVGDGETGFLVPPGDVAALTSRIRDVADDPALRERLGAQSRRAMEGHRWPTVMAILRQVLDALATGRATHQP